jgi:hypothetical protein
VAQLDGLPGLGSASTSRGRLVGWQVNLPTGLVRVEPADGPAGERAAAARVLASDNGHVDETAGSDGDRVVRVATDAADGFTASLDGTPLDAVETSAGAGFAMGSDGGDLTVAPGGHRLRWIVLQALAVLVALVLCAPTVQRPTPAVEEES